jgi:hypothetical protein
MQCQRREDAPVAKAAKDAIDFALELGVGLRLRAMPRRPRFERAYIPVLIPKRSGPSWWFWIVVLGLLVLAGFLTGVCRAGSSGDVTEPTYSLPPEPSYYEPSPTF